MIETGTVKIGTPGDSSHRYRGDATPSLLHLAAHMRVGKLITLGSSAGNATSTGNGMCETCGGLASSAYEWEDLARSASAQPEGLISPEQISSNKVPKTW